MEGPKHLQRELTRRHLERHEASTAEQIATAVRAAVDTAGGRVDRVLFAGGLAAAPTLQAAVTRAAGRDLDSLPAPKSAAALGAALRAARA